MDSISYLNAFISIMDIFLSFLPPPVFPEALPMQGYDIFPIENREYDCQILANLYRDALEILPNSPSGEKFTLQLKMMLDKCGKNKFPADRTKVRTSVIGFKWCGLGNISTHYNDLGAFRETDACCREHDHCDDAISPGEMKHYLINLYGTSRFHCKCEQAFYRCLRSNIPSFLSNIVASLYFIETKLQCFDYIHPTTGCDKNECYLNRNFCIKYSFDESKPKRWRWSKPFGKLGTQICSK